MTVHPGKVASLFLTPLTRLGFKPSGESDEIARFIAGQLVEATDYQLVAAANEIAMRKGDSYQRLPAPGDCIQAINSQPKEDPRKAPQTPPARAADGRAPIYMAALKYVADWNRENAAGRAEMAKRHPGYLDACRNVISVWERLPGQQAVIERDEDRAERVHRLVSSFTQPMRSR